MAMRLCTIQVEVNYDSNAQLHYCHEVVALGRVEPGLFTIPLCRPRRSVGLAALAG